MSYEALLHLLYVRLSRPQFFLPIQHMLETYLVIEKGDDVLRMLEFL